MADKSGKSGKSGSPWLGKPKDEVLPQDLPEEVFNQTVDDDNEKLGNRMDMARLMASRVPQQTEWPTCWSCGEKTPLLVRDPDDMTLVCKPCAMISAVRALAEEANEVVGTVNAILEDKFGVTSGDDDDDDGAEDAPAEPPAVDEAEEKPPEKPKEE